MLWLLGLHFQLQAKAKEIFTYDKVRTGFVVHLRGERGTIKIIALKKRPDGIYLMSSLTVDLGRVRDLEMFLKPEKPIYSSNYPYALVGGESPEGIVIIQNIGDTPISLEKVEVRVR